MMDSRQRTENPADRRKKPDQIDDGRREPRYHVYIRLPFNRGDFVDPGTVNWSEKKSDALWSILSDSSLENVDWTKLAGEFDVTVEFLLQMANYLTERHTSQLRAHMLRAAAARGSNAPSPVPGAEPSTGHPPTIEPLRRMNSGASRAPSALSVRRETASPLPGNDEEYRVAGAVGHPAKAPLALRPGSSRHPSANTPAPPQNQHGQPGGSRPGTATRLSDPQKRRLPYSTAPPHLQHQPQQHDEEETEIPPSPTASTTSSSSSDSPVESRIIRRPPRFQSTKEPRNGAGPFNGADDDDDDDDDDEPAFLPFRGNGPAPRSGTSTTTSSSGQDLGATLRGTNLRDDFAAAGAAAGRRPGTAGTAGDAGQYLSQSHSQTSDSSIGSAAVVSRRLITAGGGRGTGAGADGRRAAAGAGQGSGGPLSPRRMAELAARGPGSASRAKGASREGSEGTPSMGSSFSDLDDASVTQSALEEALASRMQDGTIGSRMSVIGGTIGQAIRSRYLPKPNRQ